MIDQAPEMPFLQAIEHLLATDKVVLYRRIDEVSTSESEAVTALLKEQFDREAAGYPGTTPCWHPEAAAWAARVLFHAAQLVLYRSHDAESLEHYFPVFDRTKTADAVISADICLRYLPDVLRFLAEIDVDDALIPVLESVLGEWHYSGLLADPTPEPADLTTVVENDCLARLYADRVIKTKNEAMAARPELRSLVLTALGDHGATYWKILIPTSTQ